VKTKIHYHYMREVAGTKFLKSAPLALALPEQQPALGAKQRSSRQILPRRKGHFRGGLFGGPHLWTQQPRN
jgi:hypothetical protein